MKIQIDKRYLKIPVVFGGEKVQFQLMDKTGEVVYAFEAAYASQKPDAVYYADLRFYLGMTLELQTSPHCDFEPMLTNRREPIPPEKEKLRPTIHFTAERGWINDPNGVCFYNGQYHLFYQHNPYDRVWGNMHWGHAVSDDLFHWKHQPEALFQDKYGYMFSGSAVVDAQNVSGFQSGTDAPLLFFYTCAGPKHSTQNLAISTDGGKTLHKYEGNPLLTERVSGNRDPKVIFDAERNRWLMALYFDGADYGLYTSKNLLDWTLLQTFQLPQDNECPDIYPLTAEDGKTYWIYSGAHDMYYVGEFDENGLYRPVQSVGQLSYGSMSYAAQTCYYEPGKPVIRFGWNRSNIPDAPYNGSMCTPTEMTLKKRGDRYYLSAEPVEGLKKLVTRSFEATDRKIASYKIPISSKACSIFLSGSYEPFVCSVYGLQIRVDETGVTCKDAFLPRQGEQLNLQIITDTVSTELYLNGTAICAVEHILNRKDASFSISAKKEIGFRKIQIAELNL